MTGDLWPRHVEAELLGPASAALRTCILIFFNTDMNYIINWKSAQQLEQLRSFSVSYVPKASIPSYD